MVKQQKEKHPIAVLAVVVADTSGSTTSTTWTLQVTSATHSRSVTGACLDLIAGVETHVSSKHLCVVGDLNGRVRNRGSCCQCEAEKHRREDAKRLHGGRVFEGIMSKSTE